jgi:hypothetical protein
MPLIHDARGAQRIVDPVYVGRRGRRMITEAREILATSPNAIHRRLADQPGP